LLTAAVKQRAWIEPSVRLWWLLALGTVAVFLAFTGDRVWERQTESRLIHHGTMLQAVVLGNSAKNIHGQTFSPGDIVSVQFNFNGQETTATGPIHQSVAVSNQIQIHVDPNDSAIWTDLTQVTPLPALLFVGMMFLPMLPVVLALGWIRWRKIDQLWMKGEAVVAVVRERKQTPIAPLSYAIHCNLRNSKDKRIFTVYVPSTGLALEKGSLLWVLVYGRSRPVAAMWFQ
jgi:hypothetical protein